MLDLETKMRLEARAVAILDMASPDQLRRGQLAYEEYAAVTDGRSAVSGDKLPPFAQCGPIVRAGWVFSADHTRRHALAGIFEAMSSEPDLQHLIPGTMIAEATNG